MREILAMVGKDLRILLRDRMGFFFTFFFPLVFAIFFGTLFSGTGSGTRALPIALVDEDVTEESRAFARQLDSIPEFEVQATPRADAAEAVRLGRRVAYVVLPKGFGEARRRLFYGQPPEIEIGLDPSRRAEGGMIQGVLTKYLAERMQEVFARPGSMREQMRGSRAALDTAHGLPVSRRRVIQRFLGELDRFLAVQEADSARADASGAADSVGAAGGWRPVAFKTAEIARARRGPRNAYQVSFPQGVVWAILSCAFGFALSLVIERARGTLVRLRMAPISRQTILVGKAASCMFTILTVSTTLLLIGALAFGVRPGSVPLLALAVVSSAVGFVGVMMLIAVMGRTQAAVSGLGWATMMVMSMTGGGMVPLFVMPAWMQAAGSWSPVRWAILALEGAIWRDFTLAQMALPCGILLAVGAVGFLVGTRVFRWTAE